MVELTPEQVEVGNYIVIISTIILTAIVLYWLIELIIEEFK